jgi:hypothetical protein
MKSTLLPNFEYTVINTYNYSHINTHIITPDSCTPGLYNFFILHNYYTVPIEQ